VRYMGRAGAAGMRVMASRGADQGTLRPAAGIGVRQILSFPSKQNAPLRRKRHHRGVGNVAAFLASSSPPR